MVCNVDLKVSEDSQDFFVEISKEQKRPNFKDGWRPHRFCSSRREVGGPASKVLPAVEDIRFLFLFISF